MTNLSELKRTVGPLARRVAQACERLSESQGTERDTAGEAAMLRSLGLTLTCVLQGRDPSEAVGRPFNCRRTDGAYELRYGHRPLPVEPFRIREALAGVGLELKPGETILVDAEWATLLMKAALARIEERVERIENEFGSLGFPIVNTGYGPLRENAHVLRQALYTASRILDRRERGIDRRAAA